MSTIIYAENSSPVADAEAIRMACQGYLFYYTRTLIKLVTLSFSLSMLCMVMSIFTLVFNLLGLYHSNNLFCRCSIFCFTFCGSIHDLSLGFSGFSVSYEILLHYSI